MTSVSVANAFVPDQYGPGTIVGLVAAVSVAGLFLWWFSKVILRPFNPVHRRHVQFAVGVCVLLVLAWGWTAMANEQLAALIFPDTRAYHRVIVEFAREIHEFNPPDRWTDRALFIYVMATAQRIFGLNAFISVIVNAGLIGTALLLMVDVARILAGARPAVVSAYIIALLPPVIVHGSPPLREGLAMFAASLSVSASVRLARLPSVRWFALSLTAIPIAYWTRRELAVIGIFALVVAVTAAARPSLMSIIRRPMALITACLVALTLVAMVGPRLDRTITMSAERAQDQFRSLNVGTSSAIGGAPPVTAGSAVALLVDAPILLGRALVEPLPSRALSIHPLFVAEAMSWWLLSPFLFIGAATLARRRQYLAIVPAVPACTWLFICGMTLGNYGILGRIRLVAWLLLIPFAAVGITVVWDLWKRRVLTPPSPVSARESLMRDEG